MFSKLYATENLIAEVKEVYTAGPNMFVVKLFNDDWQVANLEFATYDEAITVATDWIWS